MGAVLSRGLRPAAVVLADVLDAVEAHGVDDPLGNVHAITRHGCDRGKGAGGNKNKKFKKGK